MQELAEKLRQPKSEIYTRISNDLHLKWKTHHWEPKDDNTVVNLEAIMIPDEENHVAQANGVGNVRKCTPFFLIFGQIIHIIST